MGYLRIACFTLDVLPICTLLLFSAATQRMQEPHQLASGSTLTQQHIEAFLVLIRQLSLYRNRNSRNIGEQFKQYPRESAVNRYKQEKQDGKKSEEELSETCQ